jgi:uncharacterized protein involved in outer membrane biogenesis
MTSGPFESRRGCVIVLLLAAVLVLGALLAVHWVLDSDLVRAETEARLSRRLGQPVAIGSMRVSVLPRVQFVGSNIRVGTDDRAAPAVDLDAISIVPDVRSLLGRPYIMTETRLEGFSVLVLRDRERRWHLPMEMPLDVTPEAEPAVVVERVRVRNGRLRIFDEADDGALAQGAAIDAIEADLVTEPAGLRLVAMAGRLGQARLTGESHLGDGVARLEFRVDDIGDGDLPALLGLIGADHPEILQLPQPASASISLDLATATGQLSGAGSVTAPAVRLEPVGLDRFEASLTLSGDRLSLEPTSFLFYGGAHRGAILVDLAESSPRWRLDSRVDRLDVGDFLAAVTGGDKLRGRGTLTASLAGRLGEPLGQTMQGRARVDVVDGVVRDFPLLAALNRALQLTPGDARDTRFERLSATLAIGAGQAHTEDLLLEAGEIRVAATGRLGFDRSVDLTGLAIVSPARSGEAVRSVRELAALRNARGELELPLTIGGTLDDPAIGIDLRSAIGRALEQELRRGLERILRGKPPL